MVQNDIEQSSRAIGKQKGGTFDWALAKMEYLNEVQLKHSKEAYRLLNKSIICVHFWMMKMMHFEMHDESVHAPMASMIKS